VKLLPVPVEKLYGRQQPQEDPSAAEASLHQDTMAGLQVKKCQAPLVNKHLLNQPAQPLLNTKIQCHNHHVNMLKPIS
jgi:hypothetical protein